MDLRQLQYFVVVYELNSISAASARLHVAQPAISRSLQSLAADLGVKLFEKSGRGIRPTAAADRLRMHASQLLQDVETTRLHVQSAEVSPVGHVTLACTDQLGRIAAPLVIKKFRELYPHVTISVWEGTAATVYDWLLTGVVDVAMLTSPAPSPVIMNWGKRSERMFVAMSSRWRESSYAPLVKNRFRLADLADLPMILPRRGNSHRMLVENALATVKKSANIAFEVDGVSTINSMVVRNLGCTVLIRKALEYEVSLGLIVAVPIAPPGITAEITVVSPRDRLQTQATKEFIAMLTDDELREKSFGEIKLGAQAKLPAAQ